jgi:hypothetical protein
MLFPPARALMPTTVNPLNSVGEMMLDAVTVTRSAPVPLSCPRIVLTKISGLRCQFNAE